MKRVLLTGIGGSIGCHTMAHFFHNTDWHIVGIDSFRHKGWTDRVQNVLDSHYEWRGRLTLLTHDLCAPFSPLLKLFIGDVDYIISMAALSDVEASIQDPVLSIRNNVDVALNTLEFARESKPDAFVQISTDEVYGPADRSCGHPEWSPIIPSNPYSSSKACQEAIAISYWRTYGVPVVITNCYAMDMRLFTPNGLKSYNDIQEGDMVWTLNDKEEFVSEPVLEKVKMPFRGNMIQVSTNKVNQLVTPNHRMMVRRKNDRRRRMSNKSRVWGLIEETTAESLLTVSGRVQIPTCGKWTGSDGDIITEELIGDQSVFHKNAHRLPGILPHDWIAKVAGWYVSEGYCSPGRICFGAASQGQQEEIGGLLVEIGGPRVSGRSVGVSNYALEKLLDKSCGRLAENKIVPGFVRSMGVGGLRSFWESAMAGDGSFIKTNGGVGIVYYTKSPRLSELMAEVGMKLGMSVRICERETWNPRRTIKSKSFIVRFRKAKAHVERHNVTQVPYDGEVWCVRVPSGRVFVERGGIISLSGQTMNNFGEMQQGSKYPAMLQSKIARGETVKVHGREGDIGTRYYLHSRNHADALLYILRNLPPHLHKAGEVDRPDRYNIVGDVQLDNLELAKTIARLMNRELKYELVDFHSTRPGHDMHYGLDGEKLKWLGWLPPLGFEDSLAHTIQWQSEHPEWL